MNKIGCPEFKQLLHEIFLYLLKLSSTSLEFL